MECLKPVKTDKGSNVNKHILLTNINAIVSVERFCLLIILLLLGDCLPKNDWMFWSNVEWWTQNLTHDRGASLWETKGINNRNNQEASNKIYGRLYWQTSQSISTLHPFLTENLTVLNHFILLNFHYSCTTNQASLSLWNCVKRFNSKVDVLRSMVKINWTVYLEPAVLNDLTTASTILSLATSQRYWRVRWWMLRANLDSISLWSKNHCQNEFLSYLTREVQHSCEMSVWCDDGKCNGVWVTNHVNKLQLRNKQIKVFNIT